MEIVTYRPEHEGELLAFLRQQFPDSPQKADAAFFHWRFARNPLGQALDLYHLAVDKGRIVGQIAALRDRLWARGRWFDCGWLVDLIVAPEYRGVRSAMAAPLLLQSVIKQAPMLCITGAGPKLTRFYKALGWEYREIASTCFAIRRPGALLAVARTTGEPHSPPSALMKLADLGCSALQATRRLWREQFSAPWEFEACESFGAEIDSLVERVLPSLAVTSFRSSNYLNWKFTQRPLGTHFAITARRRGRAQVEGYMVTKIMCRRPHGRWAEVVDFLVDPQDGPVFDALLDQTLRQAFSLDVDFVRLRCSLPQHHRRLRAPFWITRNRPVIDGTFFRTQDAELRRTLAEAPWHLTSLVSDRTDHGADEYQAVIQPSPDGRAVPQFTH
jgi:hypothetical protein